MPLWLVLVAVGIGLYVIASQAGVTSGGFDDVLHDPQTGNTPGIADLAQAIAFAEGFGVPNAVPTRDHNPGDLKLSGDGITAFPTDAAGWAALYAQLQRIVDGRSAYYTVDMSISDLAHKWTATEQDAWAGNVVTYLQSHGYDVSSDSPVSAVIA